MSPTIITKFIPRTNLLDARVEATAKGGTLTVAWDPRLTADTNHANAAKHLAEKLGWSGCWYGGPTYNGLGAVFVQTNDHTVPAFIITPVIQPDRIAPVIQPDRAPPSVAIENSDQLPGLW